VTIEVAGHNQTGYSGDCLPPLWFDKSPDKTFEQQIDDMLAVIRLSEESFLEEAASPVEFFHAWLMAYEKVRGRAAELGFTSLLSSFGSSMVERAIMDALARAAGLSFARAVRQNLYAIEPVEIHPELAGLVPADWLPKEPKRSLYVRHTIGLGDPLTAADISGDERLDDGFPQAMEEYVQQSGIRYFKAKLANQADHDRDRLVAIASIIERHLGADYRITLDGNELYRTADDFGQLVEVLRSTPELATLWNNTLVIEQPLARDISFRSEHIDAIRDLASHKPVIIDEADGALDSYARALELGYRGVSSKNCKGTVKNLLNAGLTWLHNDCGKSSHFIMTGEDLCSVGIVPVQSDLCLVATLGLEHLERNGHHYHPGLDYLPKSEQDAALAAHGDLYHRRHGRVTPAVRAGRFDIESLQCTGFGFAVEPDLDSMQSPDEWRKGAK
jgi:L-alanine-DL-glutamate epimerase-like enolase superfamily enzyme